MIPQVSDYRNNNSKNQKNMKKLIKSICLAIAIATMPIAGSSLLSLPAHAQSYEIDTWEKLGTVTATSYTYFSGRWFSGSKQSGTLYVKHSGFSTYYKIKIGKREYSISRTSEVKGYNAKFSMGSTTYYLNLP